MRNLTVLLLIALFTLFPFSKCFATSFNFSGTITEGDAYWWGASPGDAFTGTYSYDGILNDNIAGSMVWGTEYSEYFIPINSTFHIQVGEYFFNFDGYIEVNIYNNHSVYDDRIVYQQMMALPETNWPLYEREEAYQEAHGYGYIDDHTVIRLWFADSSQSALDELTLPETLNPGSFDSAGMKIQLDVVNIPIPRLAGSIDEFSVPEPASMLLLGSALLGLAGFRRRFRKK